MRGWVGECLRCTGYRRKEMEAGLLRKQRRYDIHACMNWRPNWYPCDRVTNRSPGRSEGIGTLIAEARKLSSFAVLISLISHRVRLHTDTGAEIQFNQADLDIFAHPGANTDGCEIGDGYNHTHFNDIPTLLQCWPVMLTPSLSC